MRLLAYRRMLPDVELLLEYPYTRTTGPVLGKFLTGLRDGHLVGVKHGDHVLCPPLEYDPETGKSLDPVLVEVATEGTVTSWTWVADPTSTHPFDHPFAFALVLLDGTEHPMAHAVDAGSIDDMSTGMRVAVQFHEERTGSVTDFHFVPLDRAHGVDIVEGPEPVTDIVQLISLNYREPLHAHRARFAQGLLDGHFIGQRSPASGKVYVPGRGYDPLERVEMGEDDELTVPDRGTVTVVHRHHPRRLLRPKGDQALHPGVDPPGRERLASHQRGHPQSGGRGHTGRVAPAGRVATGRGA